MYRILRDTRTGQEEQQIFSHGYWQKWYFTADVNYDAYIASGGTVEVVEYSSPEPEPYYEAPTKKTVVKRVIAAGKTDTIDGLLALPENITYKYLWDSIISIDPKDSDYPLLEAILQQAGCDPAVILRSGNEI